MVDEVVWARMVSLVFGSTVYAFGLMLLLFLVGIAIGSAIFARMRRRPGAGAGARADRKHGRGAAGHRRGAATSRPCTCAGSRPFAILSAATDVAGARDRAGAAADGDPFGIAFPAAVAATSNLPGMGRGVGRVMAWNTVGTVGGAFLGGFVLIPQIGLRRFADGGRRRYGGRRRPGLRRLGRAPFWTRARPRRGRSGARRRAAASGLAAQSPRPGSRLLRRDLRHGGGAPRRRARVRDPLLQRRHLDDALGRPPGAVPLLPLQRKDRRVDGAGRHGNQLLLGHLPMLVHPAPRDIFVLGLGTGVSAAAIARYRWPRW